MARKKVQDELMDHNFDGIQELDNDLPPWWLWMFYFTIIWGFVYLLYFHVFDIGKLQYAEYQEELQEAAAVYAKEVAPSPGTPVAPLEPYTDAANLSAGQAVFMQHCMPCHGQNGEGGVGPNLTDEYWIHGGGMQKVVRTIEVGVPEKGMIPWKPVLSPEQIQQVASYILSLQGTNPPNAKAPEGEKYPAS